MASAQRADRSGPEIEQANVSRLGAESEEPPLGSLYEDVTVQPFIPQE